MKVKSKNGVRTILLDATEYRALHKAKDLLDEIASLAPDCADELREAASTAGTAANKFGPPKDAAPAPEAQQPPKAQQPPEVDTPAMDADGDAPPAGVPAKDSPDAKPLRKTSRK